MLMGNTATQRGVVIAGGWSSISNIPWEQTSSILGAVAAFNPGTSAQHLQIPTRAVQIREEEMRHV